MRSGALFNQLTRVEAGELARDGMIVLPVGATEQHGPHLPVGTDSFAVEHIARRAAAAASSQIPIVVAPTLPFGSSAHHLPFGGTMSLGTETYYRVLSDLAESLIVGGWTRLAFVNGHGGNHELIQLVVRDLALKHPVSLIGFSYWHPSWDALVNAGAHLVSRVPGHAGAFETSLVMALRPELVLEPRPHREGNHVSDPTAVMQPYRLETHGSWQQMDGYTDSPDLGRADDGERYLSTIVAETSRVLVEFYVATGGTASERRPD
jgi:creatinine amidohydrolase